MSTALLPVASSRRPRQEPAAHAGSRVRPASDWSQAPHWSARVLPTAATAAALAGDLSVILGSYLAAHWLRFVAASDEGVAVGLEHYARMGLVISLITALLLAMHGLYQMEQAAGWTKRANSIISAVSAGSIIALGLGFYSGEQSLSRLWFATGWACACVGLVAWRTIAGRLYWIARTAMAPARRILIVGANPLGREIAEELSARLHVVGYVDNGSDLLGTPSFPLLGPISALDRVVNAFQVDEVIIALPASRREQISRVITRGFRRPVQVKFSPGLDEILPHRFEIHTLGGRRYIGFAPVASVSWLKRGVDLVVTGLGVLVVSPVLLAIALAVKLDSNGPVFYRQERVGKNGRRFWMYKFRSMCADADRRLAEVRARNEASGPLFKMRDDPRITRVGRFLRRWSLDELPQLLNVLRGEMSLVGPRPPLPSEVEQYEDWQLGRLCAVPGLTGLWQVSGRSEVPFHDMVRLDLHYIRNWSLGLDVEILLRTVPAVLTNRGAY